MHPEKREPPAHRQHYPRRRDLEAEEEAMYEYLRRRSVRRVTHLSTAAILVLTLLASVLWWQVREVPTVQVQVKAPVPSSSAPRRIPLEAHIMSKCPDAKDCLHDLILPAMQRIENKVNFTLSYIGTPTNGDDGVACKHGPSECLGNIIELCAASLYHDPKIYLGFTMCLTRDYPRIAERDLVEDCALEHGIDFSKLNACASSPDGFGVGLLRDSVTRSSSAGVTLSCTVRLDEKTRCIRDGAAWKDCEGGFEVDDLVRDVEALYHKA
ncbi:MAG: hypothetical protein M1838_004846 [Thelocarpon superellum]|nr:MAG: hypothetical protein M1838_004846 [Thelocarpon superellum]